MRFFSLFFPLPFLHCKNCSLLNPELLCCMVPCDELWILREMNYLINIWWRAQSVGILPFFWSMVWTASWVASVSCSQRPVFPLYLSLSPYRGLESNREAVVDHSTAWCWGGLGVWGAGKWKRRGEENDQSFSFFWKVVRKYNSSSFSFASCSLLCPWQFLVLSSLHLLKKINSSESCVTSVSHFTSLIFLCREKKLN